MSEPLGPIPPGLLDHVPLPRADDIEVHYSFFCTDLNDRYVVTRFEAVEELNRPFEITVSLSAEDEATDSAELLGRDVSVRIDRSHHSRTFYGIVGRVTTRNNLETRQACTVQIVPALAALEMTKTSRIFQDKTAPQIVTEVLGAELAPYGREMDPFLLDPEGYETRDYCVQYQESSLDFVHRLLEEEGIGYYFLHELDGPERLVLFDQNAQMSRAGTMDGGAVPFAAGLRTWVGAEPLLQFTPSVALAPSVITVCDHDWTRGRSKVEDTLQVEERRTHPVEKRHEVYEHGLARNLTIREDSQLLATMLEMTKSALIPDGLPVGLDRMVYNLDGAVLDGFSENDARHQSEIRRQLQDRDRAQAEGVSLVTQFSVGRTFDLTGHPTLGADGQYYLTKVVHTSDLPALGGPSDHPILPEGINYQNRFECRPMGAPWRPDRRTAKPRVSGVQTAKVTAPPGMDVYTDAHGRILVRFHWDRASNEPSGKYTCWIRVSQAWAGHGFPGFMFIPRVGMEVVVAFVDGDPDRPLVTGCVYNGENPTPNLLPVQATKSILRTRSVPHGPGHNELSFEDAMGMERVHLRAERDLDELILNDHFTDVARNQTLTVGKDQRETIERHRYQVVMGNQYRHTHGLQSDHCSGDQEITVEGSQTVTARGYRLSVPDGAASIESGSSAVVSAKDRVVLMQGAERLIEMNSHGEDAGIFLNSNGPTIHMSEDKIELRVGASKIVITDRMIQVNNKIFPSSGGGE